MPQKERIVDPNISRWREKKRVSRRLKKVKGEKDRSRFTNLTNHSCQKGGAVGGAWIKRKEGAPNWPIP